MLFWVLGLALAGAVLLFWEELQKLFERWLPTVRAIFLRGWVLVDKAWVRGLRAGQKLKVILRGLFESNRDGQVRREKTETVTMDEDSLKDLRERFKSAGTDRLVLEVTD